MFFKNVPILTFLSFLINLMCSELIKYIGNIQAIQCRYIMHQSL